jgi:hypothetical protein
VGTNLSRPERRSKVGAETEFVFSAEYWFGIALFGGAFLLSLLDWRGIITTRSDFFGSRYPASSFGAMVASAPLLAVLIALGTAELFGVEHIEGADPLTPAYIIGTMALTTFAGVVVVFSKNPPNWSRPPRLRDPELDNPKN